jgi:hypothetical protein
MAIGADVAATEPTVIGAIAIWTEGRGGVDGALASSGENHDRGWRARGLGTCIETVLTGLTQWFVEISCEGSRFLRAFATRRIGLAGHLEGDVGIVGPPHLDEEADEHESDQ